MQNNFEKTMKEFEDMQDSSGTYFKFPVGNTKIRILTDFTNTYSLFEGEYPSSKFVKKLDKYEKPEEGFTVKTSWNAWAIIRGTPDELKIVQFPYSLIKQLSALIGDADWQFTGFPMSHDVTVGNTGEGGARYSLIGSPNRSEVPAAVMAELSKKLGKKSSHPMGSAARAENENDPDGLGIEF